MRLRHLLAAIVTVMFLCADLLAQTGTLTIKVRDAVTEEPLRQAQVMLSTFGGGSDSHRAFTDNTGTAVLSGLQGQLLSRGARARIPAQQREHRPCRPGAMQSADVALRMEQKPAPGLPGSTTTADELGIPKKARKHYEEGAKKVDSDPQESANRFKKRSMSIPSSPGRTPCSECLSTASQATGKLPRNRPRKPPRSTRPVDGRHPARQIICSKKINAEAEAQLLEAARLDPESGKPRTNWRAVIPAPNNLIRP